MDTEMLALFLQTSVQMGTPILLATLGGILCEKVGNMNLGIEGMMLMGAVIGFQVAYASGSPFLAVFCAGLAGAVGALIYAVSTITLRTNQVVTGLALTIFGTGVAGFLGKTLGGLALPDSITSAFTIYKVPILSDIPIIGKMFFEQNVYTQLALVLAVILYIYLSKTYIGLNTRFVGENPGAADASGVNVTLYKYVNVVLGGFLCGLGGAYLSISFVPRWQENITAGIGWIAVALVIFSTWHPIRAIGGAYLFGLLRGIGFKLQGTEIMLGGNEINIPIQFLDMIPYVATIAVLVLINLRKKKEHAAPKSLGTPYFREER